MEDYTDFCDVDKNTTYNWIVVLQVFVNCLQGIGAKQ